jgi:nitrogen fixation protein NifB
MNLENHPCFNVGAHRLFGRVHLPVAPRCNIQCKFCNRKFDCINESRPGVTSGVLSPNQAMRYLAEVFAQKKNIAVVGIAGPGDPFANPEETMETLRRVRNTYPDMMLCVATNGLQIGPYLDELAKLKVSHVTVTVNAIDPAIGEKIYSWVRYEKRVLRAEKGAHILLEKQIEAISGLKERGITVKVNSIILPGINDTHMEAVAKKMAEMKVDLLNCVPYYPAQGSTFESMAEPSTALVEAIREKAGKFVAQMRHCTRCRADAVGLLGEKSNPILMETLQRIEKEPDIVAVRNSSPKRSRVAVASMEGVLVNQHLGEARNLLIYGRENGTVSFLETRNTPEKGGGLKRWEALSESLSDCHTLLVSGIGEQPKRVIGAAGIDIVNVDGLIADAVQAVFDGRSLQHMIKRPVTACGAACAGTGGGCG